MWSASMLVTTAMMKGNCKNDASDSSASATIHEPVPSRAFVPALCKCPPIAKVGSNPACTKILETKLVVVVLPCVPAMPMPSRVRSNSANIAARGTTGMPN